MLINTKKHTVSNSDNISYLLSLGISDFFFPILNKKSIELNYFLIPFKNTINEIMNHSFKEDNRFNIYNIFDYYLVIVDDSNKTFLADYDIEFKSLEKNLNNDVIMSVFDEYYSDIKNMNNVISFTKKEISIHFLPISSFTDLESIIKCN